MTIIELLERTEWVASSVWQKASSEGQRLIKHISTFSPALLTNLSPAGECHWENWQALLHAKSLAVSQLPQTDLSISGDTL